MDFEEVVNEELVFVQESFGDYKEVIRYLSTHLREKDFVKQEFMNEVLKRELKNPTGLYLGDINVAIPHTEAKYVNKSGIAIATLKTPIKFRKMDDPEETIPVHIVFLIAVNNPKNYVKLLSKLTSSFSDKVFVKSLYSTRDSTEFVELIKNVIK